MITEGGRPILWSSLQAGKLALRPVGTKSARGEGLGTRSKKRMAQPLSRGRGGDPSLLTLFYLVLLPIRQGLSNGGGLLTLVSSLSGNTLDNYPEIVQPSI